MLKYNKTSARWALVLYVVAFIVLFVPVMVFVPRGVAVMLGILNGVSQPATQLVTLVASVCLIVVALAVLIAHALFWYIDREIARTRAVGQAYEQIRQDYEWKTQLYRRNGRYPSLPPTEIDPDIRRIEPFVPLKRRVKRSQDRIS
ncbi:MAG: hypothetical protein JXA10_09955 [Anaerolineae bacterium]|nr:hypothetical protein [Anaerolineae bacterium]